MSTPEPRPVAPLVDHFFRHEAGRLVSVLTRVSRADPPGAGIAQRLAQCQ
ncbi:MAG: hypothetical protein J2P46_11765 [Zavarzinella sp.]|nr:hypothetical protein [Zavarzinella sp.]